MREVHELLNQRWVLKRENPELYFKLKDQYEYYKPFFQDKLGYNIIINPLMVKAEKIPGRAEPWMGIDDFDTTTCYVFLCLVLMFLEDIEAEEQFVLSQITDYIQNHYPGEDRIDWTIFSQRKTLIKVLRFCSSEGLILVNDGDENLFAGSKGSMEVLYENTGVSKYFMRRFPFDITDATSHRDLEEKEWQTSERDRGIVRRHRVYRRLVISPVVYQDSLEDQDYLYIKNQRSVLENDFNRYLRGELHIHKNGAMLMMHEDIQMADAFPNRKNITDIVLQLCSVVLLKLKTGELSRDPDDTITLSEVKWDSIIRQCIETYGTGWSKLYRELSINRLKDEINMVMKGFGMLREVKAHNEILLYPAAGKMAGRYPADYIRKREERLIDGSNAFAETAAGSMAD